MATSSKANHEDDQQQKPTSSKNLPDFGCHPCQICEAEVKRDPSVLEDHMQENHGISLLEYYRRYLSLIKWTTGEWPGQGNHKCLLCDVEELPTTKFHTHLRSKHGLNKTGYDLLHGPTKPQNIACVICGLSIKHSKSDLKNHFQDCHQIPMKMYYMIYINPNIKKLSDLNYGFYNCKFCKVKIQTNMDILNKHFEVMHKCTLEEHCQKALFNCKTPMMEWASNGRAICKICNVDYSSNRMLAYHLPQEHNISVADYEANYDPNTREVGLHTCQLCGKQLEHKYSVINTHLMKEHSLPSLSIYYVLFVLDQEENPEYVQLPTKPLELGELQLEEEEETHADTSKRTNSRKRASSKGGAHGRQKVSKRRETPGSSHVIHEPALENVLASVNRDDVIVGSDLDPLSVSQVPAAVFVKEECPELITDELPVLPTNPDAMVKIEDVSITPDIIKEEPGTSFIG